MSSAIDATKRGHAELLVWELLLKHVRPLFQRQTCLFLQGRIAGKEVNVLSVVHSFRLPKAFQLIRQALTVTYFDLGVSPALTLRQM